MQAGLDTIKNRAQTERFGSIPLLKIQISFGRFRFLTSGFENFSLRFSGCEELKNLLDGSVCFSICCFEFCVG